MTKKKKVVKVKKKIKQEARLFSKPAKKEEPKKEAVKPFNPPIKSEDTCVEEGCFGKKAPGQTNVCTKHIRT